MKPSRRWVRFAVSCAAFFALVGASAPRARPHAATLVISVAGLPAGILANISVAGPAGPLRALTASTTIESLAPGQYVVTAARIAVDSVAWEATPRSQTVWLLDDSVVHVAVTYRSGTPPLSNGILELTVDGLPAGAPANVRLTALDGFNRLMGSSARVADLLPRTYAVSADYVTWGGTTFAPTPASQRVRIDPGDSAAVAVHYAAAAPGARAMLAPGFQARTIDFKGSVHAYQIFVPRGYTPERRWPIILFGHGSGEKGTDNALQTGVGLGRYVRANAETFPALVVFPQQAGGESLEDTDSMMIAMLDATMREASVDSTRQYLTGVSAGGGRAWWLAYAYPGRFAALIPISAAVTPREYGAANQAEALRKIAPALRLLPIRQYNGSNDTQVRIGIYAYPVRDAFLAESAPHYTFIEVPGATHGGTWDAAYSDPELWRWLFAQRATPPPG